MVPARAAVSVQFLQPVFGVVASTALFYERGGTLFMARAALILVVGLAISKQRTAKQVIRTEPAPVR